MLEPQPAIVDMNRLRRQIFVTPYLNKPAPQTSWIAITDGTTLDREPGSAEDGNRFIS